MFINITRKIDFHFLFLICVLFCISLIVLHPVLDTLSAELFYKQLAFVVMALILIFLLSRLNFSFLGGGFIPVLGYIFSILLLMSLFLFAPLTSGTYSWFNFGVIGFQPVEVAKLALIIVLAKYFENRHIYIKHYRYIILSGLIFAIPFLLTYLQPDLGSAISLLCIWFGMIIVAGVSPKHIIILFISGMVLSAIGWQFLAQYQKDRIYTFFDPLSDIQNTGYNINQSKIAIGSGGLFGVGIGDGTQSRLGFLPTHETDFIFAAFAEEWGFVGVLLLFSLFGLFFYRMYKFAENSTNNFIKLFTTGVIIYFMSHFVIHIGTNIGLLPVTGITLPFLSYGGSHIITEAIMIGVVLGMQKNSNS